MEEDKKQLPKTVQEAQEEVKAAKKQEIPEIKPGMTVRVHQKLREPGKKKGEIKERIQVFEGIVLSSRGSGEGKTITVRKVSFGVGVEKIFPLSLPTIVKIESVRQDRVRRAKLFYLRNYKKKLKEAKF